MIRSTDGTRLATVCEMPPSQPPNGTVNISPAGLPVNGGIVCVKTIYYSDPNAINAGYILGADWTGHGTTFATADRASWRTGTATWHPEPRRWRARRTPARR